ncbi:MAG: UPF0182 family protein [Acidimicrobiales bacterium]
MRVPEDFSPVRRRTSRRQIVVLAIIAIAVVLLLSLRGIAVFYTDYLWFRSVALHGVWSRLLLTKISLAAVFTVGFFVACFVSLTIADRLGGEFSEDGGPDELVQRASRAKGRFPRLGRILVSAVAALIVGSGTSSEWNNWLLYRNSVPFHKVDPLFHKDYAFYFFQLPFLSFLVRWGFLALVVIFVITAGAHYVNGSIRTTGKAPRVSPPVKAQMSVILGLMAAVKAYGYYLQRYQLTTSTRGYVEGAAYTDVHAQLPALTLLIFISIASCVLFLVNIRRRGWVLPGLGLGLWAFLSLVLGAIYPAILQQFVVQPAQATKELPYIASNISATRFGMNIGGVKEIPFQDPANLTSSQVLKNASALQAVRLWDANIPLQTFDKLQDIRSYYHFNELSVDRYKIGGVETPVIIGIRQLNSSNLPAQSWVNEHLQYTHGYGAVIAPANEVTPDGNPQFVVQDLPPTSQPGAPAITEPQVYFSLNNPGYVIANSLQPEIDYQTSTGASFETHYTGSGGVQLSSAITKAAFALRFSDINILISSLVDSKSRLLFNRDVQQAAQIAAPFLTLGSHPYPVIVNGSIDWVQNGYTTSNQLPYGQAANVSALSSNAPLATTFNYVRDSVKIVTNAYTGKMTFYVSDPRDPIIQVYERAFPGMFQPMSKMPVQLRAHLRYPSDLFTVQSMMYGRYHITNSSAFYNAGDAWTLSQSPGNGSPSAALSQTVTTNAQGFAVSSQVSLMQPIYEEVQLPGSSSPQFSIVEALVPLSQSQVQQNLTGMMVGLSSPSNYGKLVDLVTPRGTQVDGPALVNARINAVTSIAQQISLLDQHGSQVQLGSVSMVPIGQNLIYVRPLYIESAQNPLPELKQVIVVYGTQVAMEPTFAQALNDIFGVTVPGLQGSTTAASNPGTTTTPPTSTSNATASALQTAISQAQTLYQQAQTALKSGNLALYQQDIDQIGTILQQAGVSTSSTSSTTSTTLPG